MATSSPSTPSSRRQRSQTPEASYRRRDNGAVPQPRQLAAAPQSPHKAASSVSPVRARPPRCVSTTVAPSTTSGSSSRSRRAVALERQTGRRRPLAASICPAVHWEGGAAAALTSRPGRALAAGPAIKRLVHSAREVVVREHPSGRHSARVGSVPAAVGSENLQLAHHCVVNRRTNLFDRIVLPRRVHAVGQQYDVDVFLRINPERRSGKPGVAEGARRHL